MTKSFVHSLDIAHDRRLAEFRGEEEAGGFAPRRGASKGPEGAPPVSDKLRPAVDAGSIVSFVSGLGAEQMSDVLYSTQLAQRAASAKFDRFSQTKEWYGVYVDVLDRLGWVGGGSPSPSATRRPASSAWTGPRSTSSRRSPPAASSRSWSRRWTP